ncbi:hypothetical protein [Cytobacillus gottheilii]|uniref:hypothetical protein n=1 Tax=Cytobacillus gottheilii TaxID=859144 RepID=UPI0009BC1095|nr:hypothetical protein [Cytobacillus gottheilii]
MKIELAEFSKMSQTGSSLLKSLQNNNLPVLDLLIRESIQNSLDAALPSGKYDSVIVDMGVKDINVPLLSKHFEGIEGTLNKRFTNIQPKSLYISDKNTTGLTGNLDYRLGLEEAGNIYKLIYGISMPQTKEGAGGSWGLGKTVYFRLGIGLVIYYSRIQNEDNTYEERLAATLVEDEQSQTAILPNDKSWSRGIAWWGQELESGKDSTIPITNTSEIHKILEALHIKPLKNEETGTTVIIPFINEELSYISTEDAFAWWETSIESYLKIAVQRWYAPRLDNPKYHYGKWLDFQINGSSLKIDKMEPVFREIQYLYNKAANPLSIKDKQLLEKNNVHIHDVNLKGIVKPPKGDMPNGGIVAFKKYTKKELGMVRPINALSPFEYINRENISDTMNSPIVTYVRKPGMLINYELSSDWCTNIEVNNDEFLLAIFVPNSFSELTTNTISILEEYLRKSEEADHASWSNLQVEGKSTRLVSSIKNSVRKALSSVYKQKEKKQEHYGTTMLAKKFGKILLPPRGYGKRLNGTMPTTKNSPNSDSSSKRRDSFTINNNHYDEKGNLIAKFLLKLTPKVNEASIELIIQSENGVINSMGWEDEKSGIGTAFPIEIKGVRISKINDDVIVTDNEFFKEFITIVPSQLYNVNSMLIIKNLGKPLIVEGEIIINNNDPFVQFSLTHKFEERQA